MLAYFYNILFDIQFYNDYHRPMYKYAVVYKAIDSILRFCRRDLYISCLVHNGGDIGRTKTHQHQVKKRIKLYIYEPTIYVALHPDIRYGHIQKGSQMGANRTQCKNGY